MPLLENGTIVEDQWVDRTSDCDADVTESCAVIYGLEEWQENRETLLKRNAPLAVKLPNDVRPDVIADDLDRLAMIVVDLPAYNDGRAYTQARRLRERFKYKGKIRASGDVLYDQFYMLLRVGIDSFDIRKDKDADRWVEAMAEVSEHYQHAVADAEETIPMRRHGLKLGA